MSRKTIAFTIPSARARDPISPDFETPSPEDAFVASGDRDRAGTVTLEPEEWVRETASDRAAEPTRASGLPAFQVSARFVIDLSAERTLTQVVALSLFAPYALGWFWLMNAMQGRARL